MSQRSTRYPRRSDEQPIDDTSRSRRSVLYGGAVVATLALSGCLDDQSADDEGGSDETNGDGDTETSGGDGTSDDADDSGLEDDLEADLFAVLDAYFEASAEGDLDAIDELMHGLNPLNPAEWEDDGWEYQGGEGEVPSPFDGEVVTADGSVDDVLELEDAAFWFQEIDLDAEIGDEDVALVRADEEWLEAEADVLDDGDGDAEDDGVGVSHDFEEDLEVTTWALVTEDGEWRILYMGAEDETPADPTEVFEEEIIDEDEAVVAAIDWEYEQEDQPGEAEPNGADGEDDLFADVELARVVFTDDPGLEVDAVRAESTIEGSHIELSDGWSGAWGTVAYDPDGDQIVVRIAQDGEETVVHREHYIPDATA